MKHTENKHAVTLSTIMTIAHARFNRYKAGRNFSPKNSMSEWSKILRQVWKAVKANPEITEMTVSEWNTVSNMSELLSEFLSDEKAFRNYVRSWIRTESGNTITHWKNDHPVCLDDLLKEEMSVTLYNKFENMTDDNLEDFFQDVAGYALEYVSDVRKVPTLEKKLTEATSANWRFNYKSMVRDGCKKALYKAMRELLEFMRCIVERETDDGETECFSLLDVRNFGSGGFKNPESVLVQIAIDEVFSKIKNGDIIVRMKKHGARQSDIGKRLNVSQVAISKTLKKALTEYKEA